MSVLLLVRHGQASFTSDDYDRLSELGERQSALLGASLAARGVRPDRLVRGAMTRQRQTAEAAVAAAGWSGEVAEDPAWDEFDHLSTLEGSGFGEEIRGGSYAERVAHFERSLTRWTAGEHDEDYRESFPVFRARVLAGLERLLGDLGPRETGVVFTSGGPVSWVASALGDGGVPAWHRLSRVVVNSSATKVLTGGHGTSLITFNDHSHLETGERGLVTYR